MLPWKGNLVFPRKVLLCIPTGSSGADTFPPSSMHCWLCIHQVSHSLQGSWLGFMGACLGGVGATWKVPP